VKTSEFLKSDTTNAVLYIYTDWCESCEILKDNILQLKERLLDVVDFIFLNADDLDVEIYMESMKIDGVPYFGVVLSGDLISGHRGVIRVDGDNGEEFLKDFEDYVRIVFS
jgi:thiol-disulfide isomerase/thioredoxin